MGRQPANTKLSTNVAVRRLRVRGGNYKFRALRLDHGTYSWGSEVGRHADHLALGACWFSSAALADLVLPHALLQAVSRKVRILDVVYNASNNELVRTQTLVKNAIVQIDAAPFKAWYQAHYGVELGQKPGKESDVKVEEKKVSPCLTQWPAAELVCMGSCYQVRQEASSFSIISMAVWRHPWNLTTKQATASIHAEGMWRGQTCWYRRLAPQPR